MNRQTTINLTPSPQILEVIAEVDLQVHHCLAELIDNAVDELKQLVQEDGSFEPRIDITLPFGKVTRNSSIHVSDNGRGMSVDQLESALRAGSSGKEMLGSLGMFGMGFNIATTRLGSLTKVRTGRAEDSEWVVASIDVRRMIDEHTYEVPLHREPKNCGESGTVVTVTNLKDDIVTKLSSNRARSDVSSHLGRIYTYLLRDPEGGHSGADLMGGENFRIYVNDTSVRPVIPCIWDPSRSVVYKGTEVPAAKAIDIELTDAHACMSCGRFYPHARDECLSCGSTHIELSERRIWGWVGVQRFSDNSDFGFSFFRQGRCLVDRDKSLFEWRGPDGEVETEYPIELGVGRLVGELHMDFAKPQVRKTDFDRESREWQDMRLLIRGEAPLRPNIARQRGYGENESHLAAFFNAYRRNDPGLKCLVPGNGRQAINEAARSWGKAFRKGDPEYVTDERWYDAAKSHDEIRLGVKPAPDESGVHDPADDKWFEKEGLGDLTEDSSKTDPGSDKEPEKAETDNERYARFRDHAQLLSETNQTVKIDTVSTTLRVYLTDDVDLDDGSYAVRSVNGEVEVYVDGRTELIRDYGWTPMEAALLLSARRLLSMYRSSLDIEDFLVATLRQFPDYKIDGASIRARSETLLDGMRERLARVIPGSAADAWEALTVRSRTQAESLAISIASDTNWDEAIASGEFVRSLDAGGIKDLVQELPDLVLDGNLFVTTWASLGADARADQVAKLTGLLADLDRMTGVTGQTRTLELRRFALTADLLDAEVGWE